MDRTFLVAAFVMGLCGWPSPAAAQSSEAAVAFNQVIDMRVRVAHAPMYAAPRRNASVVNTLAWNERVLALAQVGSFYKVVHPEGGPQGFILSTQLRSAVNPLRAEEMPADVRRARQFIGVRFDVQGGVAVPHRSSSFADAYRPGASLGVRLSYPVAGPLGLTARLAYRQFGRGGSTALPPVPDDIDVQGRDLSLLAGALGGDFTLFRGRRLAFVASLDGGVYHARVDERVPPQDNPFASASALAGGGSASFRASLRVGGPVRLFAEPSYEVIRPAAGAIHLLAARVGISLER